MVLKITNDIFLEHDVIKEINISDDEKKYINGSSFTIIGYGVSDRYLNLDKSSYDYDANRDLFKVHHIYLRLYQPSIQQIESYGNKSFHENFYDLQFYCNFNCDGYNIGQHYELDTNLDSEQHFFKHGFDFAQTTCIYRLIKVEYPQYITHTALNNTDSVIKYQYELNIKNNELNENDKVFIIKENEEFIMCEWFRYFANIPGPNEIIWKILDGDITLFKIEASNFQKIINTKPAIKKSNKKLKLNN